MSEYDEYDEELEDAEEGFGGPDILGDPETQARDARREQLGGTGLENRAYFTGLATAAAREAEAAARRLGEIEDRLVLLDRMLRVSQPPMPGKLGLRWWVVRGGAPYRMPVLVSWHRLRSGRWRARKLAQVRRDRLNRVGTATMNLEATYQLALAANRLIKSYVELAAGLAKGGRDLNRCHAKTDELLNDATMVLRASHRGVVRNLLLAGYEVDRDVMGMLDGYGLGE